MSDVRNEIIELTRQETDRVAKRILEVLDEADRMLNIDEIRERVGIGYGMDEEFSKFVFNSTMTYLNKEGAFMMMRTPNEPDKFTLSGKSAP